MIKRTMVSIFVMMVIIMCGTAAQAKTPSPWVTQQENAHEIAELARAIGLPETDPIITRSQELWWQAHDSLEIDIEILTTVIFCESRYCTDEHQLLVGCAVVNRQNMFQQTLYDIVVTPRQYLKDYATPGSYYWNLARKDDEKCKIEYERCKEAARKALYGENDCPDDMIFQANFTQGSGTYKSFFVDSVNTWTYFCYK